jgi:hypothetical protein
MIPPCRNGLRRLLGIVLAALLAAPLGLAPLATPALPLAHADVPTSEPVPEQPSAPPDEPQPQPSAPPDEPQPSAPPDEPQPQQRCSRANPGSCDDDDGDDDEQRPTPAPILPGEQRVIVLATPQPPEVFALPQPTAAPLLAVETPPQRPVALPRTGLAAGETPLVPLSLLAALSLAIGCLLRRRSM